MSKILVFLALLTEALVVAIAWLDDTPDPINLVGGVAAGLALYFLAHLTDDRPWP